MSDIVVKSTVSISRNIDKFPFPVGLTYKNSKNVEDEIRSAIQETKFLKNSELKYRNMVGLDDIEKNYLLAGHIITERLARNSVVSSVFYGEDTAIMVNEEDHLKITSFSTEENIEGLFDKVNSIDSDMEMVVDYAYDNTFGYLTSRITEIGTGLRIKVILHLPALTATKYINKIIYAVGQIGLSLHKYSDEKSSGLDDFYELSNLITIGKSEWEIIESINEVIKRIEKKEHAARETIMISREKQMLDRVFRAYGTLKYARLLKYSEGISEISTVRMGIVLGILEKIEINELDSMIFKITPEKIFFDNEKILINTEEEEIRGNMVRDFMER